MGSERQARSALAMLDFLNSTDADGVLFDVTANGLGRSRSPLKLAFDPPFLAVTLTIFAAMLLAAWQALNRFGPVRRRERAIAFGKAALVDNSAALIRKAGREATPRQPLCRRHSQSRRRSVPACRRRRIDSRSTRGWKRSIPSAALPPWRNPPAAPEAATSWSARPNL